MSHTEHSYYDNIYGCMVVKLSSNVIALNKVGDDEQK